MVDCSGWGLSLYTISDSPKLQSSSATVHQFLINRNQCQLNQQIQVYVDHQVIIVFIVLKGTVNASAQLRSAICNITLQEYKKRTIIDEMTVL